MNRFVRIIALLLIAVMLDGCGGGSSTSETVAPNTVSVSNVPDAIGQPATADVQAFKLNVWNNLWETGACVECHIAGVQSPSFAQLDINAAYTAAQGVIDLVNPDQSRMVMTYWSILWLILILTGLFY